LHHTGKGGIEWLFAETSVFGTAILGTGMSRVIPSHSVAAIVWKEFILSIGCAAFLGFDM